MMTQKWTCCLRINNLCYVYWAQVVPRVYLTWIQTRSPGEEPWAEGFWSPPLWQPTSKAVDPVVWSFLIKIQVSAWLAARWCLTSLINSQWRVCSNQIPPSNGWQEKREIHASVTNLRGMGMSLPWLCATSSHHSSIKPLQKLLHVSLSPLAASLHPSCPAQPGSRSFVLSKHPISDVVFFVFFSLGLLKNMSWVDPGGFSCKICIRWTPEVLFLTKYRLDGLSRTVQWRPLQWPS